MKMRAVRLYAVNAFRCGETDVPVPRSKELLLRVGACGVCGSDYPRVFEKGTSNGRYPLTIGHEFAGEVVSVGEDADPSLVGRRGAVYPLIPCGRCPSCKTAHYAMCEAYDYLGSRRDGGFAEYCLIPSAWNLIPAENCGMEALAMTEPACVAQHAVRKSGVQAGQFLVICGAGPIGMMAARWALLFGADVLLTDVDQNKVDFALRSGLDAINSRQEDVAAAILERNRGRLADCAIEGTGAPTVLADCISFVRALGSIALLGNPAGDTVLPRALHSSALRKEVTICGVWNSSRAPYPVDEWSYTVRMMEEGKLVVTDLISDRLTLEELPDAMAKVRAGARKVVKMMVLP